MILILITFSLLQTDLESRKTYLHNKLRAGIKHLTCTYFAIIGIIGLNTKGQRAEMLVYISSKFGTACEAFVLHLSTFCAKYNVSFLAVANQPF